MDRSAFSKRIKDKMRMKYAEEVPQNKVDRIVEYMIKRFNHLTRNMNDSQRMVTARLLAADLNAIDMPDPGEPRGGAAMRRYRCDAASS